MSVMRLGDIMYLILMLEICIITVIVKGNVYCGGGGEDVNSILNTCFLIYCSFKGDFCTEKIKIKKITD